MTSRPTNAAEIWGVNQSRSLRIHSLVVKHLQVVIFFEIDNPLTSSSEVLGEHSNTCMH